MSVSKRPHHGEAAHRLLKLAKAKPVVRTRDAADLGIHTGTLTTEHHDLVVAAAAVQGSAVCLVSALRFHNIGSQFPHEVWIAVPRGTRVPRLTAPQ